MSKTRPEPIKDILTAAIEKIVAQKQPLYREQINEIWEKAAGKDAGKHSSPARIRGKTLIVNVDSPTWIYHLNIKKSQIEKKLNKLIGKDPWLSIRLRAGED